MYVWTKEHTTTTPATPQSNIHRHQLTGNVSRHDKRCDHNHTHETLQGSYKGISLTKAAENYPVKMAQSLVKAMILESNQTVEDQNALPAVPLENMLHRLK